MGKKLIIRLVRIVISTVLLISYFLVNSISSCLGIIFLILSYVIVGYDIILKALKNISRGKINDENFLMMVATIGGFCIGEVKESVFVMLFYQIGEFFQSYAVGRSKMAVASLMDIKPDYANVIRDGKQLVVNPCEVNVGEVIVVKPGEKIPVDGEVIDGKTTLDTVKLTGESLPRYVSCGDMVYSGCINNQGLIKVRVCNEYGQSTASKIIEMLENGSNNRARQEEFITKFAKYYTPIVVVLALVLGIVMPVVFGDSFKVWIYRAMSFLVVSCPCALVVSVPLSFFSGIGACSKKGILIKGSNWLEELSKVSIIACDKTGTLTEGVFEVVKIESVSKMDKDKILRYAVMAEGNSNHPISKSLRAAYGKDIDNNKVTDMKEISGMGIRACVDGKIVIIGNDKLMEMEGINYTKVDAVGTVIYVSVDNEYVGVIVISDKLRDGVESSIKDFRKIGIKSVIMLTGDRDCIGKSVCDKLQMDKYYAELMPQDKVDIIDKLMEEGTVLFVGDGINDAPSLTRASVGVAMGALGTDVAKEVAPVVIMTDDISKIVEAIKISKKTMMIVRENIIFSILVKVVVLVMVALGIATMGLAVFADVGVLILVVINAVRVMFSK